MSLAGINAASSDALRAQLPARHELKFYINPGDYLILRGLLDKVLRRDVHGDANNNYFIRSLYFDDAYNAAYLQKLDGVEVRDKYRIRIYKCSDKEIFLERKRKQGELIQKSSVRITRRLCDQIISGDPTGMERAENDWFRICTAKCAPGSCVRWSSWTMCARPIAIRWKMCALPLTNSSRPAVQPRLV